MARYLYEDVLGFLNLRTVCCYICGSRVSPTDHEDKLFTEREEWAKARSRKLYCQAAELEEMYISDCHWSRFFRVIYRIPQTGKYHLSGIGQYAGNQDVFVVPRDRDIGVIGPMLIEGRHGVAIKSAPRSSRLARRKVPIGYSVHSRCWKVLERRIGRSTAAEHLGAIMEILHRRFWELGFGTVKSLKRIEYGGDPYKSKAVREIILRSPEQQGLPSGMNDSIPLSKTRASTRNTHQLPRPHYCRLHYCRPVAILPLEIQWAILDLLEMRDILKLQSAIEWPIADAYWHSRVPTKLLFEIEDLPEENLDWTHICVSLAELELSEPFDWFRNRQRVLGMIDETRCMLERVLGSISQ